MKVAVLGSGLRTPLLLHGLIHSDLPISEVDLYDVEPGHSGMMTQIGKGIAGSRDVTVQAAARLEDAVVLVEALDRIPDRYRVAFQLYEVQRFSVAEIAKAMAIPEGTVKSHLSQARRRLRELLQSEQENICDAREPIEG